MNENTVNLIKQLAEKLGTTSEYLWAVMVKAQFTSGLINASAAFAGLLIVLIMWRISVRVIASIQAGTGDPDDLTILVLVDFFLGGGGLLTFVICAKDAAFELMSPEYTALTEILHLIK